MTSARAHMLSCYYTVYYLLQYAVIACPTRADRGAGARTADAGAARARHAMEPAEGGGPGARNAPHEQARRCTDAGRCGYYLLGCDDGGTARAPDEARASRVTSLSSTTRYR